MSGKADVALRGRTGHLARIIFAARQHRSLVTSNLLKGGTVMDFGD